MNVTHRQNGGTRPNSEQRDTQQDYEESTP